MNFCPTYTELSFLSFKFHTIKIVCVCAGAGSFGLHPALVHQSIGLLLIATFQGIQYTSDIRNMLSSRLEGDDFLFPFLVFPREVRSSPFLSQL